MNDTLHAYLTRLAASGKLTFIYLSASYRVDGASHLDWHKYQCRFVGTIRAVHKDYLEFLVHQPEHVYDVAIPLSAIAFVDEKEN